MVFHRPICLLSPNQELSFPWPRPQEFGDPGVLGVPILLEQESFMQRPSVKIKSPFNCQGFWCLDYLLIPCSWRDTEEKLFTCFIQDCHSNPTKLIHFLVVSFNFSISNFLLLRTGRASLIPLASHIRKFPSDLVCKVPKTPCPIFHLRVQVILEEVFWVLEVLAEFLFSSWRYWYSFYSRPIHHSQIDSNFIQIVQAYFQVPATLDPKSILNDQGIT